MVFPLSWNETRKKAEEQLAAGSIKEIDFSGNAYQVLVWDSESKAEYWVFLKFDEDDSLFETICQCEEEEGSHVGCWHASAAFMAVHGGQRKTLGKRFSDSIWDQLCKHLCDQLGNNSSCLIPTSDKQGWECASRTSKRTFLLQFHDQAIYNQIEKIIFHRSKASEENSFALSQFPYEEIVRWRSGHPNQLLLYRLSFWYDLAKFFFQMQEADRLVKISFGYASDQVPNWIEILFSEFVVGFYISRANLPSLLPSLSHYDIPFKIIQNDLSKQLNITYDKIFGRLCISAKNKGEMKKGEGIYLDGWRYEPSVGFFFEGVHDIAKTSYLQGKELANALTEHSQELIKFLPDLEIKQEPTFLSHQLFFDEDWNLHIVAYINDPGDLLKGYSKIIYDWAYIEDEGFYRIEDPIFDQIETIISKDKVADFIAQRRSWLNQFEGFRVHIRRLEFQLGYRLTKRQKLEFFKVIEQGHELPSIREFGNWIYFEGQGFFSKMVSSGSFILRPGLSVNKDQLPIFIKMNKDELALVPGFFLSTNPIDAVGVELNLDKQNSLTITPTYELNSKYKKRDAYFFEDVVYIENSGFYILPNSLRLPENYQSEIELNEQALEQFILNDWETLRPFITKADPKIVDAGKMQLKVVSLEPSEQNGRGWYLFGFIYETELGTTSLEPLIKAKKKKQRFVFTDAGRIDLDQKQFDWLQRLTKPRFVQKGNQVLLTLLEFIRLNAYAPVQWSSDGDEAQKKLFDELMKFESKQKPSIQGLQCTLRGYQEIGIQWLWFLYQQNLSGLLCDEMGLGKTHQAMALISSIRNFYNNVAEGLSCCFLIVCPTSVIHHWEEKIRQFLPGVRVCNFYGIKRSLDNFVNQYDILLTSYGILRNEKKAIGQITFELAIFDEIQLAKNITSRIYTSLKGVNAHMKLGLTGTPIENRLRELKSLFDIVLPSYMPGEQEYRDYFIKPIEKENMQSRKEMLNRLVNPFILRRKKADVLKELPEKIEEIAYCDLSPYQEQLYSEVLERQKRHFIEDLENENQAIPYLHIFALLSSLKQICDHPAVYLKRPEDYRLYQSGKWEMFLELLSEARDSGQKVVIFTQYLHMMDILIAELKEQRIDYASIRGSTKDRKAQIDKFNKEPQCEVFVGSLHAAGLGLDLTSGSIVFHMDRWWNKAREDQATDRVHRIGQTRGVQVFKFVTQGTFEERIHEIITQKGHLMEEVIGADDQAILKTFSREELFELLKFIEKPKKFQS